MLAKDCPVVEPVSDIVINAASDEVSAVSSNTVCEEDALLQSFFSDVTSAVVDTAKNVNRTEKLEEDWKAAQLTSKYAEQDLGSAMDQHARLTSGNYQWRNLNPYETLQLGIDATVEDIRQR